MCTVHSIVSISIFLFPKSSKLLHFHVSVSYPFLQSFHLVFGLLYDRFLFIFPFRTFFNTSQFSLHICLKNSNHFYLLLYVSILGYPYPYRWYSFLLYFCSYIPMLGHCSISVLYKSQNSRFYNRLVFFFFVIEEYLKVKNKYLFLTHHIYLENSYLSSKHVKCKFVFIIHLNQYYFVIQF